MTSAGPTPAPGPGAAAPAEAWRPSERQLEREAVRRARARRSRLVAAASTAIVATAAVVALTTSPGWPRVQETFFSAEHAARALPSILEGLWLNVRIMVGCGVTIAILGLTVAILRTLTGPVAFPLRIAATVYTDVFRGLPLLLLIYLLGFGVPALQLQGLPDSLLFWGCVALVLSYSSFVAEVFRAGIESIHPSQRAAARSLGLSHAQTLRFVVLPQAIRRVLPPLMNDLVSLQKDSGLVAVLGVIDAIRAAQIATADDFNYTPYVVAGLVFVALTIPMARIADRVARRAGHHGPGGVV
ncbi:amino acid ABC transporter permease [Agilicoccus flavus]|uniref:amino acid ABC transporter permease n=1 Tax=Agilicoccus flavus TaxID=2775968 RepID=UPI001CF6968B|nr:amino acid ABC transporter permease [Agilicoccus flavus]